jgi:hypothetical protein
VSLPSRGAAEEVALHRPPDPQPSPVAPYHPPPAYPPAGIARAVPTDGHAITSLVASLLGILLALPVGLPGLALGPLGYFLGRSAITRIDASAGASGGRGMAVAGSVLGIVATAIGAVVSLVWLVLILVAISTTPTLG